MRRIIVNGEKCSGCRYCELICSYRDNERFNPRESRIRVLKYDEPGIDDPVVCRQCAACPPTDVCPTKAFQRDEEGIVLVDRASCTSCYVCVDACSHRAVFRPPDQGPPLVCDLCHGRPLCVEKCPTDALILSPERSIQSPYDGADEEG